MNLCCIASYSIEFYNNITTVFFLFSTTESLCFLLYIKYHPLFGGRYFLVSFNINQLS
jgi:tellurite resistance protein TehA-like permease